MGKLFLGFLIGALALLMAPSLLFAQTASPDNLTITRIDAFSGVLESGDILFIAGYDIDYASLPTISGQNAFVSKLLRGTSELNADEIIPFNNFGYGMGVVSFYFSSADATTESVEFLDPNSESYTVVIQGKPTAFAIPPKVSSTTIDYRDAGRTEELLETVVSAIAEALETDTAWVANGFDLIQFTAGQKVLSGNGEDYFGQAVPNLQIMIPDLFGSSTRAPFVGEREFTFSERDRLADFWVGTDIDNSFDAGADLLNVSRTMFSTILGLSLVIGIVVTMLLVTGSVEFGLATTAITLPLAAVIGLISLTAVMVTAAMATIALLFAFFLRRAS